jgi:CheY-like chemotaxis protein
VLIVEDERSVRLLLETTLRRCGYQVLVANHGAHAVQLLTEHAGEIDLLITDVIMPEIGGGDVAREYLKLHQKGTVLFISGFTDDAVLQSGVEFNDMNFLEKPFLPGTLARKVREALDR